MQKCKVNKTTCCGYNKETKECNSIENCQHKVTYMSQTEADTIVTEIRAECTKHEECSDCAFNEFCETLQKGNEKINENNRTKCKTRR